MKNIIRSISCVLIIVMLALMCTACGTEKSTVQIEPMELEEVYTLSFDIIGGSDVMPICGYYGPRLSTYSKDGESMPEMITDEYYQMFQECGVNLICQAPTDYEYTPEYVIKMLELGDKYQVGWFVTDSKIVKNELSVSDAMARINHYANYASFCGIHVVDEPYLKGMVGDGTRDMLEYVPAFDFLKEMGIIAASNLLPSKSFNRVEDLEEYVATFTETCDAPYLSFDTYVYDKKFDFSDYFYDLSVYRNAANEAGIPLWVFIQAGSQWNDLQNRFDSELPYYPNERQFDWNVNTALAYGAKGIEYFPLIQPHWYAWAESTDYDFERNGIIGAWGNKTQWFYYAKDLKDHIAAIDEVLMNSVNKGVLLSGQQAIDENYRSTCIMEGTSWRELASFNGDTMVGCFNYQGRTALYVVAYDREYAQNITLTFQDDYNFSVIQDGQKAYYNGGELTLTMRAGEGVLIVFEQ